MKKATDALLADHKMIRRLLDQCRSDNPRYGELSHTLTRVLKTHAWYEDVAFLPALHGEPLFIRRFLDKLSDEHKDIDVLLAQVLKTPPSRALEAFTAQFRAVMDAHFACEEDALFPWAEKVLDNEGLNRISEDMARRQGEAQRLFNRG